MAAEILSNTFRTRFHAGITTLPTCRAYFTLLFKETQRIDHTYHFIDITAERQIIDDLMTNDPLPIDQERTTQRNMVGMANAISIHHFATQIGNQCDIDRPNPTFRYRRITPSIMREMRI